MLTAFISSVSLFPMRLKLCDLAGKHAAASLCQRRKRRWEKMPEGHSLGRACGPHDDDGKRVTKQKGTGNLSMSNALVA